MTIEKICTVSVIGAGQMGTGIAQRVSSYGYTTNIIDVNEDILNRSIKKITSSLTKQVEKGNITASKKDEILKRISISKDINSAKESDMVIEAVFENEEIKKDVLGKLDVVCKKDTIFASNTSSIAIGRISSLISRKNTLIGLHFMNPVPVMSFVEVIKSKKTSDDTLKTSLAFLKSIGMDYIITKDIPGFLSSKLAAVSLNEAANLLHQGMGTVEDIDKCVKKCLNHPMGPFELLDFIGIDTIYNVLNIIYNGTGDSKYFPSPVITQMVEAGLYGVKTGKGFYDYKE